MKTVRDRFAAQTAVAAPPPGVTHVLVWEPYGPSRSQWALVALDGSPDDEAALLDGPPDLAADALTLTASYLLGGSVRLSEITVDGEVGYYVTPAGGGCDACSDLDLGRCCCREDCGHLNCTGGRL